MELTPASILLVALPLQGFTLFPQDVPFNGNYNTHLPLTHATTMQPLQGTPPTLTSTPVLYEDLLWRIFMENVEFPEGFNFTKDVSPLITARRCSQVCKQWRRIFLSSPSIWGKMIDLNSLGQKTDEWRQAVLARTGEALLWVYGCMNQINAPFLLCLLQQNWCRVQAISIWKSHYIPLLMHCQGVWDCLKRPANNLERIDFTIPDSGINLPITLFGDHAPVLKVLHFYADTYKFKTTASWIRNLSSVTFHRAFSTEEVLRALKYMPQLVRLTVLDPRREEYHVEKIAINLPHLEMMDVRGELAYITAILESITPSLDCCFSAMPSYNHSGFDNAVERERYECAITKHIQSYFSHHRPTVLHIRLLDTDGIIFEDGGPADGRRFCIPIPVCPVESSSILKTLVEIGGLSDVKELKVGLWDHFGQHESFERHIATRLSALGIFSSVTTLATSDRFLEHILEDDFFVSQFLSNLMVLKIYSRPVTEQRQTLTLDPAGYHLFVRNRRTRGRPISVLEIHFRSLYDVFYLEEHTGLIVRAFHLSQLLEEYRCGDRQAERLCFGAMERRRLLLLQR
ncbi:hypothetical protein D9613_010893 [Agrocybe pediades]|uniref:F-box domain-containing protein n=1 Tax=Agrocybe pediades TaxID=84607 RepID=A0A8H4QL72_9AGAR|nr:hypothetical protein D9613_010893 [Agrocybe pediades]